MRGRRIAALVGALALVAGCASTPRTATHASSSPTPSQIKAHPKHHRELWRKHGNARPNVLLVMTDDMRSDEMRYLPNVRRYVVDRGLSFENSFSPYPLCCPARTSFLLGEYSHNHGVLYHTAPYGFGAIDDSRTIATSLHRVGYDTALVGKYLNGYGVMDSKVTGRSSIGYVPAGWTDWMAGLDTIWPAGSPFEGNTYDYFHFTQDINGAVVAHPDEYSSRVVADETMGLVDKYHRDRKPWFMWVTPVAPHFGTPDEPDDPPDYVEAGGHVQTFETPARPDWVKGRFDKVITHAPGIRVHGPEERDISDKPYIYRRVPEPTPVEKLRIRDIARQRAEALYAWDVQFGRIVRRLKETGEYANTIIMFTSDNGYYLGEHRQRQGKVKPHEPVIHVPLVVAGPGIPHGRRYTPITTFDLTRTILDIAGGHLARQDGQSKADVLYGPDRGWTYPMLTEGLLTGILRRVPGFESGLTEIGIRTGRWKFVRYSTGGRELYDLDHDPLELHSLIGLPRYRAIQDELSRLWWKYKDCKEASCRIPLPKSLRTGVAQLRHQRQMADQDAKAYYDD